MRSPTWGHLTFREMMNRINDFLNEAPEEEYRFIVGTDSQVHTGLKAVFVSAIIVHRLGKGAIYFYDKEFAIRKFALEERMFTEVSLSLKMATRLLEAMRKSAELHSFDKPEIEIHIDVGNNGKTKELVSAVVGMVKGSGFACQTKPDACGASSVADRYTKSLSPAG